MSGERIALNVLATYGRSLLALVCGFFIARWTLMALGKVDYGLLGLIGGLVGFVSIFNSLMASAVGRFFAYSIGAGDRVEVRKWFNAAVFVHLVLPVVLVAAGYPIGVAAIERWLVISPDRVSAVIWVWRFSCLTGFVVMETVPFNAMFVARQDIAEMSLYNIGSTVVLTAGAWWMVEHPSDWLAKYSAVLCAVAVIPALLIAVRAFYKYPECRIRVSEMADWNRIGKLAYFAGTRAWANISNLIAVQGVAILVNRLLGAAYNASVTVGNSVALHAGSLSSAVSGAFWPAVAAKAGEIGNGRATKAEAFEELVFRVCRLSTLMLVVFLVPLSVVVDDVIVLWLKNPPPAAVLLVCATMGAVTIQRLTEGYWMAFLGCGKRIGSYSFAIGLCELVGLASAAVLFACGLGISSAAASVILAQVLVLAVRVVMGRTVLGFSVGKWLARVVRPILFVVIAGAAVGLFARLQMPAGLLRISVVTGMSLAAMLPVAWTCGLSGDEKHLLKQRLKRLLGLHDLCEMYRISPTMLPYLREFRLLLTRPEISPKSHPDSWCMYLVSLLECGESDEFERVKEKFLARGGDPNHFELYYRLSGGSDWDDLCRRHAARTFAEFVRGKRVALVGNGPQEMGKGLGAEIDAHDVVIRINNYVLSGYEQDYGIRTDVWVKNTTELLTHDLSSGDIKLIVYAGDWMRDKLDYGYRGHIRRDLATPQVSVDYCDTQDRAGITAAIHGHPTSGGLIIEYLRRCEGVTLDAYGFSFLSLDGDEATYQRLPQNVPEQDVINALGQHKFNAETTYLRGLFEGRRLKK